MIPLVYDQVNTWGRDDTFFLELLKGLKIEDLADLGCGTGRLTTHFASQGYKITAIDPNEEAINNARNKDQAGNISWLVGDSSNLADNMFDVMIMTANVAQVFLTDESWQQVIKDAYRALKPGGHFIFDTRNPLVKVWEAWAQDQTPDLAINEKTGEALEIWTDYQGFIDDIFTFHETVKLAATGEVIIREKMQLRFRGQQDICDTLTEAGFTAITTYGDWEFKPATDSSSSFIFDITK